MSPHVLICWRDAGLLVLCDAPEAFSQWVLTWEDNRSQPPAGPPLPTHLCVDKRLAAPSVPSQLTVFPVMDWSNALTVGAGNGSLYSELWTRVVPLVGWCLAGRTMN